MADRSQQQGQQPTPASLTPRPNQILAAPATVEACRADFDDSADVRAVMAQQDARRS